MQALGFICIRHYDLMMDERLKQRYISILVSRYHASSYATQQKITVTTPLPLIFCFHVIFIICRCYKTSRRIWWRRRSG